MKENFWNKTKILTIFVMLIACSSCVKSPTDERKWSAAHKKRAAEHHRKMWNYKDPMWDEVPSHSRVPLKEGDSS